MFEKAKRFTILLLVLCLMTVVQGRSITADADEVNEAVIDDVKIELENRTGTFHFLFRVEGSAPEYTDHVNVTFGYSNSTSREMLGFWIEPVNLMLFGNGMKLVPTGTGDDNWTSWKMELGLNVPMDEDPSVVLGLIGGITGVNLSGLMEGIPLGNITEQENITDIEGADEILDRIGITDPEDLLDPVKLLKVLGETEILVIARAIDGEGGFTEGEKDIKIDLIEAVFGFLTEEGYIEGVEEEPEDEKETSEKEENEDDDPVLLYIMGGVSVILLICIVIFLVMILLVKRREKDQDHNIFK